MDEGPPIGTTNNQTGMIKVSYNGGALQTVLHWDSAVDSEGAPGPNFHGYNVNEQVFIDDMKYNGTSTTMQVEFSLTKAYNDWWWALDNLRLFVPAERSILCINTATGAAQIVGGDAISTSITSFDITSANGNLAPIAATSGMHVTKPDSIDSPLDPDAIVGNSNNESWQLGVAQANHFAEFFLAGSSAFNSSRTENLGLMFNPATPVGDRDVKFLYSTIFGDLIEGIVQYVSIPASPDFDSDGDIDGADFLRWQRGIRRPRHASHWRRRR